jgi:hypothetical protein
MGLRFNPFTGSFDATISKAQADAIAGAQTAAQVTATATSIAAAAVTAGAELSRGEGIEVALDGNEAHALLAVTLTGLAASSKYVGSVSVNVSIWQEGAEANCGEADCCQTIYVVTDGAGVATCTVIGTPFFDTQLAAALSTTAFALAASAGGFTVSATRPAGVACAAVARWCMVRRTDGTSWRNIT